MSEATDFLGRSIAVDDTLIYPVRRGSRMWLNRIVVSKVESDVIHGANPQGRRVQLTNLNNTIVVRPGKITPEIQT